MRDLSLDTDDLVTCHQRTLSVEETSVDLWEVDVCVIEYGMFSTCSLNCNKIARRDFNDKPVKRFPGVSRCVFPKPETRLQRI